MRAFPLEFPMGLADPCDPDRPRDVSRKEHVQHLLRYRTGHFVEGRRGHRVIWTLVNSELINEAAGKGFAVHSCVMKRLRGGVVDCGSVLTRAQLRDIMKDEAAVRTMVNQLTVMGRDVRSTPMQWSYEGKKLDAAVKFISWRPPWVRSRSSDGCASVESCFIKDQHCVDDQVGLGRIPSYWWTQNCRYNYAYDVQRLNITAAFVPEALVSKMDEHAHVRFAFTKNAPDLVAYMLTLRTELNMRILMPTVVPHDKEQPYLGMARMETGESTGHPHWHGFSVGKDNPGFRSVVMDAEPPGELAAHDAESQPSGDDSSVGASIAESDVEEAAGATTASAEAPEGSVRPRRSRRAAVKASMEQESPSMPQNLARRSEETESQTALEKRFWRIFGDRVSEWNPCFDDQGGVRFRWDAEVGAHDVLVDTALVDLEAVPEVDVRAPERMRLRHLLEKTLQDESNGGKLDLQPVRRLVAALVNSSARHTKHEDEPISLKKHACRVPIAVTGSRTTCCRVGVNGRCVLRRHRARAPGVRAFLATIRWSAVMSLMFCSVIWVTSTGGLV